MPKTPPLAQLSDRNLLLEVLPTGGTGVEIGVHKGAFSSHLLRNCAPDVLHLIDPWISFSDAAYDRSIYGRKTPQQEMDERYEAVCTRFAEQTDAGQVVIHRAMSDEVAGEFEDGSLDFVYVDGDHSLEGVRADIELYWPKLRPGGIMAGDDYHLGRWWGDGVVRAFSELAGQPDTFIELRLGAQIAIRKLDT